jgi:hypothetical protein
MENNLSGSGTQPLTNDTAPDIVQLYRLNAYEIYLEPSNDNPNEPKSSGDQR